MQQAKTSILSTLTRIPLFNGLAEAELGFIGPRVLPRHFDAGQTIFSEGDACRGLYVIEAGTVKLFGASTTGREQILLIQGPGSTLGELPVLDGGSYPASAAASTDTDLLFIKREDLQALCLQHQEVAVKLLRSVAARLRPMIGIVEQLCFTTVRQRLAALLLRLGAQEGKITTQGLELKLTSSNRDLAAQIGTVPELVSRNLGFLQSSGLIKVRGKNITIFDRKALQAEAENYR